MKLTPSIGCAAGAGFTSNEVTASESSSSLLRFMRTSVVRGGWHRPRRRGSAPARLWYVRWPDRGLYDAGEAAASVPPEAAARPSGRADVDGVAGVGAEHAARRV